MLPIIFSQLVPDVNELPAIHPNVHLGIQLRFLLPRHLIPRVVANPSQMSSFHQPELDSKSLLYVMLAGFLLLHLNLELDVNVIAQLALVVLLLIDLQGIRVLLPHHLHRQVVVNPSQISMFLQPVLLLNALHCTVVGKRVNALVDFLPRMMTLLPKEVMDLKSALEPVEQYLPMDQQAVMKDPNRKLQNFF